MPTHNDHQGFDDAFGRFLNGDTFSRLLFEGDDCRSETGCFPHYPSPFLLSSEDPPKGLFCFDDFQPRIQLGTSQPPIFPQSSTFSYTPVSLPPPTGSDSSSIGSPSKSHKKKKKKKKNRNESGQVLVSEGSGEAAEAQVGGGACCEKKKADSSSSNAKRGKVRKQRIGEGIAALQQLVCPYGKSDAASVLHEAMGYIRFLQEQVKVLCVPYLQSQNPTDYHPCDNGESECGVQTEEGLRRKGLCLMPADCIAHIADSNGADLWSHSAKSKATMPWEEV